MHLFEKLIIQLVRAEREKMKFHVDLRTPDEQELQKVENESCTFAVLSLHG